MSASITAERVNGAVLLVNEVFGTHSEHDAKRLHHNNWEDYVDKTGEHLDNSIFLACAKKSELLLETLDKVLGSVNSRIARAARLRFGIDDGRQRTLKEVGEELDPERVLVAERARQLIARCTRSLKWPTRSHHLAVFLGEKTTAEIRAELKALPEPGQKRVKAP